VAQGKPGKAPPSQAGAAKKITAKPDVKTTAEERAERLDKYTVKPEFWDTILDALPPWGDEIAAIVLIIFGVMSFLSLLNASPDASVAAAWSNALTGLFGYGSALVCAGIFGLGVIILLPKLGIVIRFPTRRILALEIAFLSVLALLHLIAGENELRTLARLGRGGGQVGWALSSVISGLLGSAVALAIYGALFVISVALVFGIRRDTVLRFLRGAGTRLREYAVKWTPPPAPEPVAKTTLDTALKPETQVVIDPAGVPALVPTNSAANAQRVKAYGIMRIRVNPDNLPPSLRPGAAAQSAEVEDEAPIDVSQHPLFQRRETITNFNAIGVKQPAKKGAPQMVERPDGRIKRFFTVENMKEPKQIAKRSTVLPPLTLLSDIELSLPDENEINHNVVLIENTLLEFDIDVDVVDVRVGPTVTQYAIQPFREKMTAEGETAFSRTRINKIAGLASDLALSLSAKRLRLEAPVPGHSYIGIEVPNKKPSIVALRSVYESKTYYEQAQKKKSPLFIPLGRDVSGAPVGIDLSQMPHLLIAGTTGSGKSVCIAAMATALVMDNSPDQIKMVMLDPKMVELSRFNGLPHLLGNVETEQERIIGVLRWCTREMDRRYRLLEESAARNIDTYNERLGRRRKEQYMPFIVIMIDEIGDLMLSQPDETEKTITRLAQMARAVGMHLVVATQRPSVDVITGLIKATFPSRIAFAVASGTDSRVILDSVGAETLMGRGDMLYQSADAMAPRRLQGCWVSDDEVRAVVNHWKAWKEKEDAKHPQVYEPAPWERGLTRREVLAETDEMLEQAISMVIAEGEASASLIQRKLNLGYPRAARMMDLMVELGVVGDFKADRRSREVLIKPGTDPFKDIIEKRLGKKS